MRLAAKGTTLAVKLKDPVCGHEVDPGNAQAKQLKSEYEGKTYYFDTAGCKQRFDKDPHRYLSGSSGHRLSRRRRQFRPPRPRRNLSAPRAPGIISND